MTDDLRARLTAALKEVRLWLGPNALAMAQRGEPLMMSGNEREAAADVVLAVVQPELDRLRVVEADYLELTSKVHPLATCSHGVSTVPVATLARKIAEKREALAQRDEACREVDRARAERDAALAALARVREYAVLMTDSVVVPVRGYGQDLVHLIDCPQDHNTIAEQDACTAQAGAGGTGQDGAQ